MMPGILSNPPPLSQARATGGVSMLTDEVERPFCVLQAPMGAPWVRGLSKAASQPIPGSQGRSNPAWHNSVNIDAAQKPRLPENLQRLTNRAVPDYGSSGSEHDPSSVSLFAMVHEFIENDGASEQTGCIPDSLGCQAISKDNSIANGVLAVPQTVKSLALCKDSTEERLLKDTQHILNSITNDGRYVCDGKVATFAHSCLKRTVMGELQMMGYIAAICKTKWDQFCGIPAGDYEYIDVLVSCGAHSKPPERFIVDMDFQAQFEIARPTDEFTATWRLLPSIFVGRAERLKQIIHIMSEATKQSMRVKGLHLPPWRKSGYLKAKWFSAYKRTSNSDLDRLCRERDYPGNGLGLAVRGGGLDAKCTNALEMLYHDAGPKCMTHGGKDVDVSRSDRDAITVTTTDWQPPAMDPRCMAPRRQGHLTGLTSLFSHGPAPSCDETLVQAA